MASTTLTLPAAMASPAAGTIARPSIWRRSSRSIWARLRLRAATAQHHQRHGRRSGPSRYDGGGIRYLRFRAWLDSMAQDAGGIGVVHYEEVRRHLGTDAAHVYGGCWPR